MPMARLKEIFEKLGFSDVKTFIASGNVIFSSNSKNRSELAKKIEKTLLKEFSFVIPVLLRSESEIAKLVKAIPKDWVSDKSMKCDVMFLWREFDNKKVLESMSHDPKIEDLVYVPGAVIWRVDRKYIKQGRMVKIVGTQLYRNLTIRNSNTVRKICELMM